MTTTTTINDEYQRAGTFFSQVLKKARANLVGRDRELRAVLVALVASGHILLEGVPGVAKTQLLKDIAEVLGLDFARIQFTVDKLPSDVTGYVDRDGIFVPGPVYLPDGGLVLGDEINRASPKTQAALLESMEELQVTVDNETHIIEGPYMVMATQNPLEHHDVYPLPMAQLDRFLMKLDVQRTSSSDLIKVGEYNNNGRSPLVQIKKDDLFTHMNLRSSVVFEDGLEEKLVKVLEAIEANTQVVHGPWERGYIGLRRVGQACALLDGSGVVKSKHVLEFAPDVLRHRVFFEGMEHEFDEGPAQVEQIINDALRVLR